MQEVGTIRLKELRIKENPIPSKAIKGPQRDWLTLAARELLGVSFLPFRYFLSSKRFSHHRRLVDIKYITNSQIIELNYEGLRRRFTVHSITPRGSLHNNATNLEEKLSHDINALSLDQPKQLWSVTWDCVVSITSDDHVDRETASHKVLLPCIFLQRSH